MKELGVGPNWSYIDNAVINTDPTTTIADYVKQWVAPEAGWIGTPEQIADMMEEEHDALGANGGFMIAAKSGVPGGLARFVHEVVPILQYRGLMKTEYQGSTMRENLVEY